MAQQYDLFGNPIVEKGSLREKYGVNPFTILDAKDGVWAARKGKWIQDLVACVAHWLESAIE